MRQSTLEKQRDRDTGQGSVGSAYDDEPDSAVDRVLMGLPQIQRLVADQRPDLELNAFEEWSLYQ
ncbi:MAG: hypothetical protein DHS20C16_01810 [Phycisphaerae bacterium]|nr:MAG: hypothetical protein DHS20C16_01810 [Phycisphaerae bacterium]